MTICHRKRWRESTHFVSVAVHADSVAVEAVAVQADSVALHADSVAVHAVAVQPDSVAVHVVTVSVT